MPGIVDTYKHVTPRDRNEWRKWLAKYHNTQKGIWLTYYKKSAEKTGITYDEAVKEALSFGWIDGLTRSGNDEYYLQLFTPRKPKSGWSAINKKRVEKLLQEGLIADAGMAAINQAKENGSWEALDKIEAMEVPAYLKKELAASKTAKEYYESLSPSVKKMILYWLQSAKREETRVSRVSELMQALSEQTIPQRFKR